MNYNLITYRKMLRFTQTAMSKELGIGLATYYKKETGINEFTLKEIKKILEVFKEARMDLSFEQVFGN